MPRGSEYHADGIEDIIGSGAICIQSVISRAARSLCLLSLQRLVACINTKKAGHFTVSSPKREHKARVYIAQRKVTRVLEDCVSARLSTYFRLFATDYTVDTVDAHLVRNLQ